MWVSVDIVGLAVGGPSGMSHAYIAGKGLAFGMSQKVFDLAFDLVNIEVTVEQGNSGRVIAAIFQPFQTVYENGKGFAMPDITNDSTHITFGIIEYKVQQTERIIETVLPTFLHSIVYDLGRF